MKNIFSAGTIKIIHRWLAFILGIFIVFQITSGSVAQERYLLMQLLTPETNKVESRIIAASPSELLKAVSDQEPEFNIAHVMLPSPATPNSATVLMGGRDPDNPHMSSIIINFDQYERRIINEHSMMRSGWIGTLTVLHRWILFGKAGVYIVCILALATILMSLSGLYLFFKTRQSAKKLPIINRMHRSLGFIAAFFLIATSSTGILMSITAWEDKNTGRSVFSSLMNSSPKNHGSMDMNYINADLALKTAQSALPDNYYLGAYSFASDHSQNYWFAFFDDKMFRQDILINGMNGDLIGIYPAGKLEKGEGFRKYLLPIHSGYYFGSLGGLMMTFIGFIVILWLISGLIIYYSNRKRA